MNIESEFIQNTLEFFDHLTGSVTGWVLSPGAWSQFMLLALASIAAVQISRRLIPKAALFLDPGEKDHI